MTYYIRMRLVAVLACSLVVFSARADTSSTLQVTTGTTTFSPGFKGDLERVVARNHGAMGLSVKNIDTGEEITVNGDEPFPTASTIKLAVMCTVFDELSSPSGRFKSYYDTRTYDASTSISGAGFVQQFRDGAKIELKELMHFMITASDNTATNMLVDAVGGLKSVNNWLMNNGFAKTRMAALVGGREVWSPELRKSWGLGVTTPNEMRRLCEMILSGKAGSTTATDEMLRLMGHQYFDGGIPAGVPPTVWVGTKSGAINSSRSDNGIVASKGGTYILSIYTKENEDTSWKGTNEADTNIREISRIIYNHYNPDNKWKRPEGAEKL